MKKFKVHRDIRRQAVIFGLPASSFYVFITFLILSAFILIFEFSLLTLLIVAIFNVVLFLGLAYVSKQKGNFFSAVNMPKMISNKYPSLTTNYENNN